jgi:predicted TIM-barrel fold metal-dependent hydrolase
MAENGKIDTHQHFFPKPYVDAIGMHLLAAQMPNKKAPQWSPEEAIATMDTYGIDEGVLSVSSVPSGFNSPALLRACNESAATLRARFPGRFGSFASLPLPDIDASLKEVEYAFDDLKVDGFILFASYEGWYLGDPHFIPLLEELNRRKAVAFVHPNDPSYGIPPVAPASVLEFPFETTRTAASLIISGAMANYAGIRFILAHAGGALPYLLPRLSISIEMMPDVAERIGDVRQSVRAFYFDTALSVGVSSLAALAHIADPGHILFGTDFPMAPEFVIAASIEGLDRCTIPGLSIEQIFHQNGARLLNRS